MKDLSLQSVLIRGKYYRVMDFPYEDAAYDGPSVLRKGIAYRIETDMTKGLFPYRGIIGKKENFNPRTREVGIYMKDLGNDKYAIRIAYPHSTKERAEYSLDNVRDIAAAMFRGEFKPDQFREINMNPSAGGKTFRPPIRAQDDPLNTIVKAAIREKDAPFEPYGKRLEALAVDRSGIEGVNIKNNTKRALWYNSAMSSSKAMTYCDTWQLEAAFIVRDSPDSVHPMFEDGKMLIIYPSGPAFEIDPSKLINVQDMVADAIKEANAVDDAERRERERKELEGEDPDDKKDDEEEE